MLALPAALLAVWLTAGRDRLPTATAQPELAPNSVSYRYRFGGQTITRSLHDVAAISVYRHEDQVDQVVFRLTDGRFYVLNGDILVDYDVAPGSTLERDENEGVLFNHYDPYLQAEKQEMHRQWVNEQYQEWVGRPPTYDEWITALNELTRGVEHYQMGEWIQYSPAACEHYATARLTSTATDADIRDVCARVFAGATYDEIEEQLGSEAAP